MSLQRYPGESGRLAVAALLAVSVHAVLASLPVDLWHPIAAAPPVLRVTLAAPAPVAAVAQPVAPVATTPMPAPPAEPAASLALAVPAPQAAPPSPTVKPKPRPSPPVERIKETRSLKPKPLAPAEPPPVAIKKPPKPPESPSVAKTTVKSPQQQPDRARPVKTVAPSPERTPWTESASEVGGGRNLAGRDMGAPGAGKAREDGKASGEDGGRRTAVASAPPSRPAAIGVRPLPGNPPPRYPPLARQRGIEGRVLLRLTVNAGGGVEAVSIAQSSGNALLDQEAKLTVARWRFHPPGLAQAVAQVPVAFRLKD